MTNEDFDTEYTDYATCPHCGYENQESDLLASERQICYEDDSDVTTCDKCGKEYSWERITTIKYGTEKIEVNNE